MQVVISVGGRFHAYHTAAAAQQAGYLKQFITTGFNPEHAADIDPNLVTRIPWPEYTGKVIRKIPPLNNVIPWNWVKDNQFDWMASKMMRRCDLFHVWNHYGLYSLRRAKKYGAITIVERASVHPLIQHRLLADEYARFGLKIPKMNRQIVQKHLQEYEETDYIMVCSSLVFDSMVEEGIPPEKLLPIQLGVDIGQFSPAPKQDATFRILFVGISSLQKGTHHLLEAFKQLALPNAELVLVGSVQENFKPILAKYSDNVVCAGPVPHQHLARYYSNASLFVLPSIQDGFAMVVAEAMACGLPVIISENVGAKDIVRDNVDGFITSIRNVDALKEKILYFYRREPERQHMGKSAGEQVQQFTWRRYRQEVIQSYEKVILQSRQAKKS